MDIDDDQLTRPSARTLELVSVFHWLANIAQVAALLIAKFGLDLQLPYVPMVVVILLFGLWNVASSVSSRWLLSTLSPTLAVPLQLFVGILVLATLLYLSGGATSPFVSLFLLPIAIAALTLNTRVAVAIGGFCVFLYWLLLQFYVPLQAQHMHGAEGFSFHVFGMWVNFLLSTTVIVAFLSTLANLARDRAQQVQVLREQFAREQQIVAMGGLAASAAHSLSTPLSTVAVVLDEIEQSDDLDDIRGLVRSARSQLALSRERLSDVLASARVPRSEAANRSRLDRFAAEVCERWQLTRPEVQLDIDNQLPQIEAMVDPSISHCLITLLDNAADASAARGESSVKIRARYANDSLEVEVEDLGGGPVPQLPTETSLSSSKPGGSGAGLFIARTNLERLGGALSVQMSSFGCVAMLCVPIERFA